MREAQDNELGGTHGSHADLDDHAAFEDVERRHGLAQTDGDVEGVFGFYALQSALPPQGGQEILDHGLHTHPGIGVVGFEDELLGGFFHGFLHEIEEAADADVAPLVVVAGEGAGAPHEGSFSGEGADDVDGFAGIDVYVVPAC